ncbi:hypothetical protein VTH82DRAFT_6994 [Thermothelomyces myriococcoides]
MLVSDVIFPSRDDNLVATRSEEGIHLWNVTEARKVSSIDSDTFTAVAAAPDGKLLTATRAEPGLITLWKLENGQLMGPIKAFQIHPVGETISSITVSVDGQAVVSISQSNDICNNVKLWDLETGKCTWESQSALPECEIAFRPPNGDLLAVSLGIYIELHNTREMDEVEYIRVACYTGAIAFSRDGNLLGTAQWEGSVQLWDMTSTYQTGLTDEPYSWRLSFNQTGDRVAISTFNADATVSCALWSVEGELLKAVDTGYQQDVWGDLMFSPDERFVLLPGSGRLQIWDKDMSHLFVSYDDFFLGTFSPDSSRIAMFSRSKLRIVDCITFQDMASCDTMIKYFDHHAIFSPDSMTVAWISKEDDISDKQLQWFNLGNKRKYIGPDSTVYFAFSPKGTLLAAFGESRIVILDTMTGERKVVINAWNHRLNITPLDFHPQERLIAALPDISEVIIYDTNSGQVKFRLKIALPDNRVVEYDRKFSDRKLVFSKSGKLATTVSRRNEKTGTIETTVQLWDLTDERTVADIGLFTIDKELEWVRFSDDSQSLESNAGKIPLPSASAAGQDEPSSETVRMAADVIYRSRSWVCQGLDNLLWLPPDYRFARIAVRDSTIIIAHKRETAWFIELDLAKIPLSNRYNVLQYKVPGGPSRRLL